MMGSQKVMPPAFLFCDLTSWTYANFTELHYNIAEGTVNFQSSLHVCGQSSYTFEQEHAFLPSRSFCPSSAATGTLRTSSLA